MKIFYIVLIIAFVYVLFEFRHLYNLKMTSIKKDKKNSSFGKYPCNVYLHNALRYIEQGKYSVAYSEICYALQKANDVLSEHEKELWNREGNNNG